jgi:hypothetical protein
MLESISHMFLKKPPRKKNADAERLALLDHHAGVGPWDLLLHDGDRMRPKSTWHFSGEFRRLLGLGSAAEFPDVAGSWADRRHPDDAAAAAFEACLSDTSGRTSYNATYRLKMKDGPGIPTPDRIKSALDELAGLDWVRQADPNRAGIGGRSRNDWTANPALTGGAHGVA